MKNLHFILPILMLIQVLAVSCTKRKADKNSEASAIIDKKEYPLRAIELSFLPEIRQYNIPAKNRNGEIEDMLQTVAKSNYNTIRLRLWKKPSNNHSSFAEVKAFAQEIKALGLQVWLTVHYSDTWADPGAQSKPQQWTGISFKALKDSMANYTNKIMQEINPEYIQIGNEINGGLLWPEGSINNKNQMLDLMDTASKAIRITNPNTQIILHFAGLNNSEYFFETVKTISYDIIGLSYYPLWHGKSLNALDQKMSQLAQFNKPIIIAETAYPFTFGWDDYTNNIIGDQSQILSDYVASPDGQKEYLTQLKSLISNHSKGYGLCYWGAEWVAFKGKTATNGSSWENQALWDFSYMALPALDLYK